MSHDRIATTVSFVSIWGIYFIIVNSISHSGEKDLMGAAAEYLFTKFFIYGGGVLFTVVLSLLALKSADLHMLALGCAAIWIPIILRSFEFPAIDYGIVFWAFALLAAGFIIYKFWNVRLGLDEDEPNSEDQLKKEIK